MLSDAETITLVRALWPGVTVAAASDAFLTAWLPSTRRRVDDALFGEEYDTAVAHLLAHRVYRPATAGAGSVISLRTGKLATGYSDAAASRPLSDSDLARTVPGAAFLEIRDSLSGFLPFVAEG